MCAVKMNLAKANPEDWMLLHLDEDAFWQSFLPGEV